jgi:hypothetical protein
MEVVISRIVSKTVHRERGTTAGWNSRETPGS